MKHIKLFENFNTISLELLTNNLTKINIKNVSKLLKVSEYYETLYNRYVVLKKSQRRSEDLYKETGIKGLVGDWLYPFNDTIINNEYLLIAMKELIAHKYMDEQEMVKLYKIYQKLNPLIKTMPVHNDYFKMYHVMLGMTSGFNYDDIYDYLTIGGMCDRDDEYKNLHEETATLLKQGIYYIPSEKTLKHIIKTIKENEPLTII